MEVVQQIKDTLIIFKKNSKQTQDTYTLYMNYLAVVYAFFLPISWQARSTIFVLILLLFILRRNYIHYINISLSNPIVKAFLLYLSIYFIWLIGTENFTHAKKMIKLSEYAIIPFIFLTFLTKEFGYKVIASFIGSVLFSEILSYLIRFQWIPAKFDFFGHTVYKAVSVLNPTPYLLHMHYTVTISIVVAILFFELLSKYKSIKIKIIAAIFILTATINLTLVQGRSGYLSYVILLITVVFLRFKKKALIPLIGIVFFISFVAYSAYNYNPQFQKRVDYSVNTITSMYENPMNFNSSLGTRIGLWYYSLEAIKNDFIFGLGTGDQMDEVRVLVPEEYSHLKTMHHLHNQYFEMLTQFGLVGLFIFLNIFYQIFKYKNDEQESKNIMIIVSIGIMVALLTETFSSIYYLPMFATLISATIAKNKFLTVFHKTSIKKSITIYISIAVIALIAIVSQ